MDCLASLLPQSVAPERWGYLHPDAFGDPRGEWRFVRPVGEPAFPDRFETADPFENGMRLEER